MKLVSSLILLFNMYFVYFLSKSIGLLFRERKNRRFDKQKSYKILFLENLPVENAGYQNRSQMWGSYLGESFQVHTKTIIKDRELFEQLTSSKNIWIFHLISLYKKFFLVFFSNKYEVVIVRRELLLYNDYCNLFLEKFLLKIHPNVILDFDDDIAYAKGEPRKITSLYGKLMKENGNKFSESLLKYKKFIVGSDYLMSYVLKVNTKIKEKDICVIPTCVDYEKRPQKKYPSKLISPIVLGWIGSNGNLSLLDGILPELNKLHSKVPIKLIVISGKEIHPAADFEIENIKWNYKTQIENLLKIDIGLMPLKSVEGNKGKCGFKLIQYMGLGIVSVASNLTINSQIIDDGENGFLISLKKNNWAFNLEEIISKYDNFGKYGNKGHMKIKENYSFISNKEKYVSFLQTTLIN